MLILQAYSCPLQALILYPRYWILIENKVFGTPSPPPPNVNFQVEHTFFRIHWSSENARFDNHELDPESDCKYGGNE